MSSEGEFAKLLAADPSLIEKLQKRADLDKFREKYNVLRATPLKCPACSQWGQSGGSLWINKDDKSRFVCRKCKLEWIISCQTVSNEELIIKMRKIEKEE